MSKYKKAVTLYRTALQVFGETLFLDVPALPA